MAIQTKDFHTFYDMNIAPELGALERKRKLLLPTSVLWRILFVTFFVVIMGVFTGVVIRLQPGKGEEMVIGLIRGFFSLILLIILLIVSGYLVKYLRKKNPERFSTLPARIAGVILISAGLFALPLALAFKITEDIHSLNDISFGTVFKSAALILFVGFPSIFICLSLEKKFYNLYKRTVISKLVPFVSPSGVYTPAGFVPREEFEESKLFPIPSTNYSISYQGTDRLQDKTPGNDMMFSLLNITSTSRGTSNRSGGSSGSSSSTIFKGLFLRVKGDTYFKGETVLRPNTAGQRAAGKVKATIHFVFHTDSKKVLTGDEDFDMAFLTYTTREENLQEVLSPVRKKLILEIREQWEEDMHLSFVGNTASIAVLRADDDLQPSMFRSLDTYEETEPHYDYLVRIFSMAKLG